MKAFITKTAWPVLVLSTLGTPARAHDRDGARAFAQVFSHTNGRTCATCHVLDEHTTLTPDNVVRRLVQNPRDPLFLPLDADDPNAAEPTWEHLAQGLVRVVLPLPDNMDVIDAAGNVITVPERRVFVWRGVPTIENAALSAPYQLDGRLDELPEQALAAIVSHGEGNDAPTSALEQIARFELDTYSSGRARRVGRQLLAGMPLAEIPIPERAMRLSEPERRGRDLFDKACGVCHGGATMRQITDRAVHDALFFELGADGNVVYDVPPGAAAGAALGRVSKHRHRFAIGLRAARRVADVQ
jgi:cytochrome c peroxidase